jgi:hypothetical protein
MGFQAQNFFSVFGQFYTFISGIFIRCSGFLALSAPFFLGAILSLLFFLNCQVRQERFKTQQD